MTDASARTPPPVTEYFTGLAETYAAYRPTYPLAAIEAALDGYPAPRASFVVADVGCGTGICTRLLARIGTRVIGIDPNPDMLVQARRESANHSLDVPACIEFRQGTGERTGLDNHSVDLVMCAQSFHWFNAEAALREFHRITKLGRGRLALMWNVRDDRDEFTAGYGEIVNRAQADAQSRGRMIGRDHAGDPTIGGWFESPRTLVFLNPQMVDLEGLLGRAHSASYFPKPGNPLRAQLDCGLRRIFDSHQRDGCVTLHHRTELTLARRRG
jgi:SAM-dependent methyltransferase